MKKLFHLTTTSKYLNWFSDDWNKVREFMEKHHMDGIELGLTHDYDIGKIPGGIVWGVHLSFYPTWLEFWRGRIDEAASSLGGLEQLTQYYGGLDRNVIIENYKQQYARAKALKSQYMVFHVSHVTPEDSFTWRFNYTDKEVLEATLELINEVFTEEDGPKLLFENLWWPGLTYTNPELTKWFIDGVQYKNKGYLVDISHLILTNPKIGNEMQAYNYIKNVIKNLGETAQWIQGVHLNKTLPKHYMNRDHLYELKKYQEGAMNYKWKIMKKHIQNLDPHLPFDHEVVKEIIALINPLYCVYETNPDSVHELAYFIKQQNKYLDILY